MKLERKGWRLLTVWVVFLQMSGAAQAYDSILPREPKKVTARLHLSEVALESLFQANVKPFYFDRAERAEHPVLCILTGLPGSGKSYAIAHHLSATSERKWSLIDFKSDDVRKLLSGTVGKEASGPTRLGDTSKMAIAEKLLEYGVSENANMLLSTRHFSRWAQLPFLQAARGRGFKVAVKVITTPLMVSEVGIVSRFEQGKLEQNQNERSLTTHGSQERLFNVLPVKIKQVEDEKLVDQLTIVDRSGTVLYENRLVAGNWERRPSGDIALMKERARPMTDVEIIAQCGRLTEVVDLMRRSNSALEDPSRYNRTVSARDEVCGIASSDTAFVYPFG